MRKLIALVSAAMLLASVVTVTVAPIAALASCSTASITLYEDANGGGDSITLCEQGVFSQWPDLNNIAHTQPGICNSPVTIGDDWNDCVSSVRITLTGAWCIKLYDGANYTGTFIGGPYYPPQSNVLWNFSTNNDKLTSIKMRYNSDGGYCDG